ncbi:hypothetical protein ACFPTY_16685 [Halomonas beimenensis]|uniref:Outer membrane protein domain-containing protein n=1 Tax=Halomonas beimenensis TaxID=475662 RepID=A0A291PCT9_9GAMM|nr:hypothetical protein [Halomonas beimenensis]ATJ84661.1 hypothetical protein BEI_3674 [Halomonas beimenensis]
MINKMMASGLIATALTLSAGSAQAFEDRVALTGLGGTTGLGADVSWRFHERFGLTAQYAGGLTWDGDYDTDEVHYEGDLDIAAGALKLDFHPFAGSFFLSLGAMLPDMSARVTGTAEEGASYEFDGQTYTASDVGELRGDLTIADGVQPYAGLGWRSSQAQGLGFFAEFGVMAVDVDVELSSSKDFESQDDDFRQALRNEEARLEDEADELPVYPVALLGVSYTF